jgi:hypothetical protein
MTNKEIEDKVGKKGFLSNDQTLAAKMDYKEGIPSFDNYLNGKTLKQIRGVIHLVKYPRGLVFKIAKLFSYFPFAVSYKEIKNVLLDNISENPQLVFSISNGDDIKFFIKEKDIIAVNKFLLQIRLKYDYKGMSSNQSDTKIKLKSKLRKKKK